MRAILILMITVLSSQRGAAPATANDPVRAIVGRLDLEKYKATIKGLTQFGDRRHYQLDVRQRSDALAASRRCAEEGADLLMVKPGLTSLDLIGPIKQETALQVGA